MGKTKVDFIADLLANKAIKTVHKERLFSLVSKELGKIGESDESILSRLKELETEIKLVKSKQVSNEDDDELTELDIDKKEVEESEEIIIKREVFWKKYSAKTSSLERRETTSRKQEGLANEQVVISKSAPPNPENTKNFLTYFRNSEGLKYLTHDFKDPSEPPDRKSLLEQAKIEFEEALNKYPNVPNKLQRRIVEFAFKENPDWFIRKGNRRVSIKEGWCSKKFVEWFDSQKSPFIIHPCRSSKWNKLMIEPFKKSIQVRDEILLEIIEDNIKLINDSTEENQIDLQYNEQLLKMADFYTDVDSLSLALYQIFSSIKVHALKQKNYTVLIDYLPEFENKYKCIRICHLNSKPTKSLDKDFLGGDMTEVRNTLFGLCNWAIESSFEDGDYQKYFLYDRSISTKDTPSKLKREVTGFTHLLMFY